MLIIIKMIKLNIYENENKFEIIYDIYENNIFNIPIIPL